MAWRLSYTTIIADSGYTVKGYLPLREKLLTAALPRPWCCPEPRCLPIHNIQVERDKATPGDSFVCFGVALQPIAFSYDGVEHSNDLNHCDYTPLKGVIRFQENADDWRASVNLYNRALNKLKNLTGTDWPGRNFPR